MTRTADINEFSKHLQAYLDEVKAGNEVLVLQDQKAVARLVPTEKFTPSERRSLRHLVPLSGEWKGEEVLKSSALAEEMFSRE
jgi:antitoxin (DNA-binding transcriptional repressor) of toxin-antitoxin stability system